MPGVADLCRTAVEMASDLDADLGERVRAAAAPAVAAVESFTAWLNDELHAHRGRRLPPRPRPVRAQVPPRAQGHGHAGRARGPRGERPTTRSAPRCCRLARELWPAWIGDEPMPDDGDAAHASRARRHRGRPSEGGRAARLLPRGERADRGVHPRARPHRPGRRPAPDHLDPALPASLRRRDADPARAARPRAWTASSPSPRRPTTGPRSRSSRSCASTTRASCAC